ncbi:hypothetical protein EV196_103310 [Mariniflexile fucanivorans]|uniref:Uncharacterized protein n=1 Tax=Mariniflexile fucanivorans TaxID=264023 RepID=A0A4R1RLX5_9FLAO|nr:hypothetical protein [Mariniflexile fucanivorans]TCL66890.1 hypothetical protein EV196_103310 [Mariniflexile fucanivorans]
MTLHEKKRKAAVIAATIYLNMEEKKDKIVSQYGWSKMGMIRRMNDRKLLFSNGRTIGGRII